MEEEKNNKRERMPKGAFNKAVEFLKHLQYLENLCDEAAINNDFHTWFHALQAWFNKISGKLDSKKIKFYEKQFSETEGYIYTQGIPDVFIKMKLNDIHRSLEKLMNSLDYQMPEKTSNGFMYGDWGKTEDES